MQFLYNRENILERSVACKLGPIFTGFVSILPKDLVLLLAQLQFISGVYYLDSTVSGDETPGEPRVAAA